MSFENDNCCVCVSIFADCDKKEHDYNTTIKKPDPKDNRCCVCVNIFADCNDKGGPKEASACKFKDCCVCLNIFADCEQKKCHDCCRDK